MRKVITEPSFPGSTDIGAVELDANSRDGIPALLIGLQAIYGDEETRTELFRFPEAGILPGRRRDARCRRIETPRKRRSRIPESGGPRIRSAGHAPERRQSKIPSDFSAEGGSSRAVGLEKTVMPRDLRRKALSISAIARPTGLDRKTVRKAPCLIAAPEAVRGLSRRQDRGLPGSVRTSAVRGDQRLFCRTPNDHCAGAETEIRI